MAHELEILGNSASFAYNSENGTPWHKLGTIIDGNSTPDEILVAARADYEVHKSPLTIPDPHIPGREMETPNWFTWRTRPTVLTDDGVTGGDNQVLGIVGGQYAVIQNAEALQFAMDLANFGDDDQRHVDCAGVLNDGRRFFATITLPDLVLDPNGFADRHTRRLVIETGHDGRTALRAVNTTVRAVCSNTVGWAMSESAHRLTIHHRANIEISMAEARQILGFALTGNEEFELIAMNLAGENADFGFVTKVADKLWGTENHEDLTDVKRKKRDERLTVLSGIWNSPTASAGVGANRWAAFNTFSEYFEHHANTRMDRAERAIGDNFGKKIHGLANMMATV